MKSTLSGFLLLMISRFALSQNALTDDPMLHKNQLGINASYFVSQFINFDGFDYYQYPSYMLYYRRILAPGNIRVAFGANYNSEEIVSRYDYDSTLYTNIDYDIAFSAEWEWDTPISKKWWVY